MIVPEENYLEHYGILRKSGRYPWGSGSTQSARNRSFLDTIESLKADGMSDVEICRGFSTPEHPFTTSMLRAAKSNAKNAELQADISKASRLKELGNSNVAIGKIMGINESSVRALLDPNKKMKADVLDATSNMLKAQVDKKKYIDIGSGVEYHLNISNDKLKHAVAKLKEEGYTVHYVPIDQLGTKHKTTLKVLAGPETPYSEVIKNKYNIQQVMLHSDDGGLTYSAAQPPLSISSKRVGVKYAEQGGTAADGVIYVRPGVSDVSLGKSRYAQVRVMVDGSHYLKGMAMYHDDMPPGVDLLFNTNKKDTGNKLDAMKPVKKDPTDPFGAIVRQIGTTDHTGKKTVTSAMNLVNEEKDWDKWSKTLSSQMLSKQKPALAKTQLDMTYENKRREFDEISKTTNPTVKKRLFEAFADDADSSAVHLKAAHLPRQENKVILPINSMKENEIYAPTFHDGERVVLIRFPHGGKFEIPELVVNNRHPEAKRLLGNAPDAIGIHSKVAERLSGADFDGDTVLVIPNDSRKIKTEPALEGLKGFDPQAAYPAYEGMPKMSARTKGREMGNVSNLITDMTIRGASNAELARAVRHSMVVIDAEKHNLNYKQSAINNGIADLKRRYQGKANSGASTLISRATSDVRVNERKARGKDAGGPIDKATGEKRFTETGATYTKTTVNARTGKVTTKEVPKTEQSVKLAETTDAHTLSSGTPVEKIYADHSNRLKGLANTARKEASAIRPVPYSPSAKLKYAHEVDSLTSKLNLALRNSPLERQAQLLANAVFAQKKAANPDMEPSEVKKLKAKALTEMRHRTGAGKERIVITDKEWEAIQAGAVSTKRLNDILSNADLDQIKKLATPKTVTGMSSTKKNQALALLRGGYTQAEVASHLGISVSTLKEAISGVSNDG